MHIDELNNFRCSKVDNVKIRRIRAKGFTKEEQENHINHLAIGYRTPNPEVDVCCSYQPMIRKYLTSEYFELSEVLISTHPETEGYVLQVVGYLEPKGYTIKQKKKVMSEEHKQMLRDRMTQYNSIKGEKED